MMKRVALTPLILAAGILSASAEEGRLLNGDAVKKTITGKTVYLRIRGIELPIAYRRNGTMVGRLKAFAASMAGNVAVTDSGRWWVANNQLCQRWNSWLSRKSYCFKLKQNGSVIYWTSNDGRSGTARISS
ncbi:MAG: hypothetical protein D6773_02295 [Alphaproteobacteria bacterium]|nr:MAG: hypothetical protein D6773_02295 [Alphaproteobacteria bacterium]